MGNLWGHFFSVNWRTQALVRPSERYVSAVHRQSNKALHCRAFSFPPLKTFGEMILVMECRFFRLFSGKRDDVINFHADADALTDLMIVVRRDQR